ncbi:MAG: hypothetical protein NC201_04940 [Prevotella sp.]|nr:hypothetical protein [Bacteroides sp.]MCM1366576.1 hypothetical protein [Prevotella sp.]MCM1437245.1 hypothetical protein [Prevotella sp.]
MKKFYALFASALVAASAFAAPKDLMNCKATLSPEGARQLHETALRYAPNGNFVVPEENVLATREYEINGLIYTLRFVHEEENDWWKVLTFNNDKGEVVDAESIADYPFVNVMVLLSCYDSSKGGTNTLYLPFYTVWPTVYTHSQRFEIDASFPEEDYDYSVAGLAALAQGKALGYCNKFKECENLGPGMFQPNPYLTSDGKGYEAYVIMSGDLCTQIAGVEYKFQDFTNVTTYQDANNIMEYEVRDYDDQTHEINFYYNCPLIYNKTANTTGKQSVRIVYNGVCRTDFEPTNLEYTIHDLHIFNTGVKKDTDKDNPYSEPWGPLTRYYMYGALNEYLNINYPADMTDFSQELVGFMFKEDTAPAIQLSPIGQSMLYGALYSAADSKTFENQQWSMLTPGYTYNKDYQTFFQTMYPVAGSCIPSYRVAALYDDGTMGPIIDEMYPEVDGLTCYYQSDNEAPMEGTLIKSNTTKGFEINGLDMFRNRVDFTYQGNIKFHGDPKNAAAYTEVSAMGENDNVETVAVENASILVQDGVVYVNATADTSVAVYAVNGTLVKALELKAGENTAIELGNGIYIVKAGNDVKKVVL